VRIAGHAEGAAVHLTVADDGPGIPESRRAALANRFARADASGPGHGLGLAIAADIAEAAGGRLALADAAPGLAANLILPVSTSSQASTDRSVGIGALRPAPPDAAPAARTRERGA
jgi:signal transduction histidine kinase